MMSGLVQAQLAQCESFRILVRTKMFLIVTKEITGLSPFYPSLRRGRQGKLVVMEWERYRKHNIFLLICNLVLVALALSLMI